MERTLILLKPDCMQKKLCGRVLSRFEEAGFTIRGCKMIALTQEMLRMHYAHIADKSFYPAVEEFMSVTPVIALVIEGEQIVEKIREMLGVTDSRKAAPGTIRNELGVDQMINIAHASDSIETAEREISMFFTPQELFNY